MFQIHLEFLWHYETAEKVLSLFEKEGLRGIIELKFWVRKTLFRHSQNVGRQIKENELLWLNIVQTSRPNNPGLLSFIQATISLYFRTLPPSADSDNQKDGHDDEYCTDHDNSPERIGCACVSVETWRSWKDNIGLSWRYGGRVCGNYSSLKMNRSSWWASDICERLDWP